MPPLAIILEAQDIDYLDLLRMDEQTWQFDEVAELLRPLKLPSFIMLSLSFICIQGLAMPEESQR